MTFEDLVTRIVGLYDVTQAHAVDVTNERLNRMVSEAESLQAVLTLSTTVANQTSYSLAANIVNILRVKVGTQTYDGSESLESFWDIDNGDAATCGFFYALEPDTDSDMNTSNLRLYPAPSASGTAITGLAALQATALAYASATALPIPLDCHEHLLAGVKAEILDEKSRQDESAKFEAVYQAGVQRLQKRATARAKGSGRRRLRMVGYDMPRA